MKSIGTYEWAGVFADGRDPDAGGASHAYKVRLADGADVASVQLVACRVIERCSATKDNAARCGQGASKAAAVLAAIKRQHER